MSFIEYEDAFVWECDSCGLRAEFPPTNFWASKDEVKARGWHFFRDDRDGVWSHTCAKCVKKQAKVSVLDRKVGRIG